MKLKDLVISKQNIRQSSDESEDFENLKESIKKSSLLQKIVLRPFNQNQYEVVAGGRRFRALCALNDENYELKESEYVLHSDMDDDQALLCSIEENTQRLSFSPLELNRAGLALNKMGLKDKEIAKVLNITPHRLKRILNLSSDFNKMPDKVKSELGKLPENAVFTDKHWEAISKKINDKEVISDVVDYIMDKELPAKEVPSVIKMVETNRKAQEDTPSLEPVKVPEDDQGETDPLEYSHKGELVLENKDGKDIFKVIGKGEDQEIPLEHYLEYLKHPEKFKCFVTFKLKIKTVD